MKYIIYTLGCKVNQYETQAIEALLASRGHKPCREGEIADAVIVNTCAVTSEAGRKSRQAIHRLKEENPGAVAAVLGCYSQLSPDAVQKLGADIVYGTADRLKLVDAVEKAVSTGEGDRMLDKPFDRRVFEELPAGAVSGHTRALLKIQDGCVNFCSYCIVPYVRGRERSRTPEAVIAEVKELVARGCSEIALLGQNVNSYGKDLDTDVDFADLIRMVNDIEGVERIRFMTSHPKDLSDKLIDAIAECDKVCKQLHLPVQAGSNKILKEMNRKYTKEDYLAKIEKVKKRIPNISLSTDIIVGFPTETKEDFEETLDVLRKVEYDNIFSFIYSRREGTPAAKLDFVLTDEEIHENFNKLLEVQNEISKRKNEAYVGRVEKVLVDGVSKNDETTLSGRCDSSKIVNFKGDKSLIGKYIDVRITEARTWSLNGEIAE